MNQSQLLQPVLFGGLFIGVLSGLPIIDIGNCCCCLWVIGGGTLTAWLQQRDRPEPLTLGEGAFGGFLAGIAGAVVYLAVAIPVSIVTAPLQRGMMEFLVDSGADFPPEVLEMLENMGSEGVIVGVLIWFVVMLIAGMIFATLGGLLGVLIFRPSSPPPPFQGRFPQGPPPPAAPQGPPPPVPPAPPAPVPEA